MIIGRNNGVVRLTRFSDRKMCGLLLGSYKVVIMKAWMFKLGGHMAGFYCIGDIIFLGEMF